MQGGFAFKSTALKFTNRILQITFSFGTLAEKTKERNIVNNFFIDISVFCTCQFNTYNEVKYELIKIYRENASETIFGHI